MKENKSMGNEIKQLKSLFPILANVPRTKKLSKEPTFSIQSDQFLPNSPIQEKSSPVFIPRHFLMLQTQNNLPNKKELPDDVLNGERLRAFNKAQKEMDPLMRLTEKDLRAHPEIFSQIVAESAIISQKFAEELKKGMEEIGLKARVKATEKQPSRILEKLSRKTKEKGIEQTLSDLVDLAKCRIEVKTVKEIYQAAEKVKQMYGDRILEWDDTILHPRANGYTGRIHMAILNEERTRKLELQITTQDLIKFNNERFPVLQDYAANFHDLIYKGLGGKVPEIVQEYYNLQKEILELNQKGESLDSNLQLVERIKNLKENVSAIYRTTPKENWPVL
jgi:ppGpp synthetase/RelA/SpoT-type nucleotidyltranferase